MEQKGTLILAQADHLTGEEIGYAIEKILALGANNVYSLAGITKKNRPGCVLLIDIYPEKETDFARLLADEFSILGYHRILTSHYCSHSTVESRTLVLRKGNASFETEARFKTAESGSVAGRIEHADLVRIRDSIQKELGSNISLTRLRAQIESEASTSMAESIEIHI